MAARTAISAVVNDRYTIQCARRSAPSTASFIDSSSFSFSSLVSSSSSGIYVSRITNCIWNATMGETQRAKIHPLPRERARSASPIGRSLNQKVRVSRFDQTCNPHPALSRLPLPEGEGTHFDSHVLRRPRYLFWPVFSLLFSSFSPRFSKRVPFFSRCSPRLSFRSPFLSSFSPALTLP